MSAENTTDTTTAPNSGVSLEVGATYRRHDWAEGAGVTVTAVGQEHFLARNEVGVEHTYTTIGPGSWVRVTPTPADRWQAIHDDGTTTAWIWDYEGAVRYQQQHGGRVARFTFAEWIDTEQTDGQ